MWKTWSIPVSTDSRLDQLSGSLRTRQHSLLTAPWSSNTRKSFVPSMSCPEFMFPVIDLFDRKDFREKSLRFGAKHASVRSLWTPTNFINDGYLLDCSGGKYMNEWTKNKTKKKRNKTAEKQPSRRLRFLLLSFFYRLQFKHSDAPWSNTEDSLSDDLELSWNLRSSECRKCTLLHQQGFWRDAMNVRDEMNLRSKSIRQQSPTPTKSIGDLSALRYHRCN